MAKNKSYKEHFDICMPDKLNKYIYLEASNKNVFKNGK